MKLKIDRESDAFYLRLDETAIVESEEVQPGVILDFDKGGLVIGSRDSHVEQANPAG